MTVILEAQVKTHALIITIRVKSEEASSGDQTCYINNASPDVAYVLLYSRPYQIPNNTYIYRNSGLIFHMQTLYMYLKAICVNTALI